jgi:uncharacterized protein YigE (DUF2233 family)
MRSAFLTLLLLLAACGETGSRASSAPEAYVPCNQQLFDGSRFTVCDGGSGRIELVAAARDEAPIRNFADLEVSLGERARLVAFAMNAGMYGEDGRPIGLAIVNGRQVRAINRRKGGGNFHLMPNGVFQVRRDGKAEVVTSASWQPSPDIRIATQSGPMLVIDGAIHPRFDKDGESRFIRNGVGIAAGGRPLFVISNEVVSFGKLARFFRDGLKTPNALYFDGSVSSLWDPATGRMDAGVPLGPIIVALKPAAPSRSAESAPGRGARATP